GHALRAAPAPAPAEVNSRGHHQMVSPARMVSPAGKAAGNRASRSATRAESPPPPAPGARARGARERPPAPAFRGARAKARRRGRTPPRAPPRLPTRGFAPRPRSSPAPPRSGSAPRNAGPPPAPAQRATRKRPAPPERPRPVLPPRTGGAEKGPARATFRPGRRAPAPARVLRASPGRAGWAPAPPSARAGRG